MRVALIEVSHWHYPLYVPGLSVPGVEVVAVSDRLGEARGREAARYGARAHDDPFRLIAEEDFDLAFVFGRHDEMAAIGLALVEKGVPFAIEKPAGLNAAEVARLARAAAARELYVAVPLIQRLGPLGRLADRLRGEGARFTSASWRFFAGPPERYSRAESAWMLEPEKSGGGALMNLANHFIDFSLRLLGAEAESVFARLSSALHGRAVEDYAMLSLALTNGTSAMIETGYAFPDSSAKREYSFTLVAEDRLVKSREDGVTLYNTGDAGTAETIAMDLDTDPLYGEFTARVLAEARTGARAVADLDDLARVMRIVDAGYRAAALGAAVAPLR